jgi:hypothetical protein
MPSRKLNTDNALDTQGFEVPGSPNFERHIDGLLKEGNIAVTAAAQSALNVYLKLAWLDSDMEQEEKRAAPNALFKQLDASVRKTEGLLRRIQKYPRTEVIGNDICIVGDGAVDVATAREMMFGKTLSVEHKAPVTAKDKSDGAAGRAVKRKITRSRQTEIDDKFVVMVSRFQMLARLRRDIARRQPWRKRGNQPERDKSYIVAHAASFFRRYSAEEPTAYPNGPFAKFCRSFYVIVTRSRLSRSGLEKAIRAEIRTPTFTTQSG